MNMPVRFFLLLCLCLMAGCEGDGMALINEFIPQRVRISREQPPEGQGGKAYAYSITAEVKNDPNDSDYDYQFNLIEGTIPPGTQFASVSNKYAEIAGIPSKTGQFSFAVSVETGIRRDWSGDDGTDEAIYTITIRR